MADPHNHTHQQRRHTRLGVRRGTRLATLAVLALTASILAIVASPATAAEIKTGDDNKAEPSATPTFTACLGPALDDAGFEDLEGLDNATDAINCLAYYGITTGRNGGTQFDPDSNVTRGQMALFLYRAAKAAGIDLMGGDMDAMYGDIDELSEERQAAIKALARNNILTGRNTMSFYPLEDITRAEMAIALVNLTQHTAPGSFHQSGSAKGSLNTTGEIDHFTDARRSVPRAVDTHISYAYELGITTGYPNGTNSSTEFRPNNPVPRRNMATFITRALNHSNLRPEGLTAQSNNGTITVSIRDADFRPVDNESVDAFYVDSSREDRAFNNDGECRSIVMSVDMGRKCKIDVLDPATNADGNAQLESLATKIGKGITVWAWTGDNGDEVDEDTDLFEFEQAPVVVPSAAGMTAIAPDPNKTPKARFGASVQFTAQLQYTDTMDTEDTADDVTKNTVVGTDGKERAEYGLTVSVYSGQVGMADANFDVSASGALTVPDADGSPLGLVSRSPSETLKTDSDGKVTFELTTTDPSATSDDDYRTVVYVLKSGKNAPHATEDDPDTDADETVPEYQAGYVVFSEDRAAVTVVRAAPIRAYAEAPSAGGQSSNGVVVTVLDQYHRPMRNQRVTLSSSVTEGQSTLPGGRTTASTGTVRITYEHTDHAPKVETITVNWNGDAVGATDTGCKTEDAPTNKDVCGTATLYWALRTATASVTDDLPIVAGSLELDEIVVDQDDIAGDASAVPWLLRYDENDILQLNGDYVDVEAFESALAKILDPDNEDSGTKDGWIKWSSYDHDDEDDRTLFQLSNTDDG